MSRESTLILEELKLYLRVDEDDDDTLIKALMLSAEEYLANAGVTKDYTKELYKLSVKLLVGHWYENREVERVGKNVRKVGYSLESMITQLKYCSDEV